VQRRLKISTTTNPHRNQKKMVLNCWLENKVFLRKFMHRKNKQRPRHVEIHVSQTYCLDKGFWPYIVQIRPSKLIQKRIRNRFCQMVFYNGIVCVFHENVYTLYKKGPNAGSKNDHATMKILVILLRLGFGLYIV
jgi:hypothetical protein